MNIGDNISRLRKLKKLTQEDLSQLVGVSKNTIWNYENNKRKVDHDLLLKISNILEVDISELLGLKNVEGIIDTINKNGYTALQPLDKKNLIYYFRNVLFNIGVVGLDPYNPKDEDLHRVLASEEFQSYTKFLINKESDTKEGD